MSKIPTENAWTVALLIQRLPSFRQPLPFLKHFRYNASEVGISSASTSRYPKSIFRSFLAPADDAPREPSRTTNLEQLLDDWETLFHPQICANAIWRPCQSSVQAWEWRYDKYLITSTCTSNCRRRHLSTLSRCHSGIRLFWHLSSAASGDLGKPCCLPFSRSLRALENTICHYLKDVEGNWRCLQSKRKAGSWVQSPIWNDSASFWEVVRLCLAIAGSDVCRSKLRREKSWYENTRSKIPKRFHFRHELTRSVISIYG